ncbi:barstar family protein [Pseudomonas chlororaphis subsp. aurantiaca]|uniref:barstar family protein n=1 Tax=Pseudomonas chlororaphis TaxID=587753 RepID=UPI00398AD56B
MLIKLDGSKIKSEADFHKQLALSLDVREFYGHNLNALWDLLSANVERPIELIWENSNMSRENMGDAYEKIITILERTRLQDEELCLKEKFTYRTI